MNHRQLALAAMHGRPVDHIPFIARMELWYDYHCHRGTLPAPYARASLFELQRDLGIGIFGFRNTDTFYRVEERLPVARTVEGPVTTIEYETPFGALRTRDVMAASVEGAAVDPARVEYPFKTSADYDALLYLLEHTVLVENYDDYGRFMRAVGDDGLALPWTGHLPAHDLMIHYMGYETFYLEMYEHPAQLEQCVAALTERHRRLLALAVGSPCDAVELGGNYDEDMTPPPIFARYFAPLYREARRTLEAHGKALVVHGDGNMRVLLRSLLECGVQVVEALTPRPMTGIDIAQTRALWQGQVTMWGGIPCVLLTDSFTDDEFERSLEDLFCAVAPGERFILGLGDNVPTDALFSRVLRLAEFWRERGRYPLAPAAPASLT